MSGFSGLVHLDGRPIERAVLERMHRTLAHRGGDSEGLWSEGAAGLACHLFRITPESRGESQPAADGAAVLVFDGRLDNREELLWRLPAAAGVTAEAPDSALVLAAYHAYGEELPAHLEGEFALALYDRAERKLLLARDALGVRPLYYHQAGSALLFASEIKALLAHPAVSPRPRETDLADFLLADSPLSATTLTFFEDIYSLPPSHLLAISAERQALRRYWDFDTTRQTRFASFEEYAEAFRVYFDAAVRRRLRCAYPVGFSVSGGLDSSAIFCLAEGIRRSAPSRYPRFHSFTFEAPQGSPADELAYIEAIEQQYGVSIERVPVGRGMLDGRPEALASVEQLAWHVEGPFLDDQWATSRRLLETARQRGVRLMITGHWGDQVLFTQAYLMDLLHRFRFGTVRRHLRQYRRWMTDTDPKYFSRRLFLDLVKYHVPAGALPWLRRIRAGLSGPVRDYPWYSEQLRRLARPAGPFRDSRGDLLRQDARFVTTHAHSLYEEARARYHVLSLEWNSKVGAMHGLEMTFPFLDRDLLAFLMSIPGNVQTRDGVPKAILRQGMSRVLPEAIARRSWKADFFRFIAEGMEQDFPHLVGWLDRSREAARWGYIDEDALEKGLATLRSALNKQGGANVSRLVNLLGLEMWLRTFFSAAPAPAAAAQPEASLASPVLGGTR